MPRLINRSVKRKNLKKSAAGKKAIKVTGSKCLSQRKCMLLSLWGAAVAARNLKRLPFYTHKQIELPQIELNVTHYVLHKGCCSRCGKTVSAKLRPEHRFGYGPRMSALIAELSGMQGASRRAVVQFLNSVFGAPISTGAVQKVIDRVTNAMAPAYKKIGKTVRSQKVVNLDETSWLKAGKLHWL